MKANAETKNLSRVALILLEASPLIAQLSRIAFQCPGDYFGGKGREYASNQT